MLHGKMASCAERRSPGMCSAVHTSKATASNRPPAALLLLMFVAVVTLAEVILVAWLLKRPTHAHYVIAGATADA